MIVLNTSKGSVVLNADFPKPCAICAEPIDAPDFEAGEVMVIGHRLGPLFVVHTRHFYRDGKLAPDYHQNTERLCKIYARALRATGG